MLTLIQPQQLSTKELSALYDRIYNIADRLFKKHNPCNIHITNGIIHCNGCTNKRINKRNQKDGCFLCCNICKHQSINGCTIKCLPCKLFLCNRLLYSEEHKALMNKLKRLKKIAAKCHIDCGEYFHTKKEVLSTSKRRKDWDYWDTTL